MAESGQQRTPAVHTGSEELLHLRGDLLDGFEVLVHRLTNKMAKPACAF